MDDYATGFPMQPEGLRQLADNLEEHGIVTMLLKDGPQITFVTPPPPLAEAWVIRQKETGLWLSWAWGYTSDIGRANVYDSNEHINIRSTDEWVKFVECPF